MSPLDTVTTRQLAYAPWPVRQRLERLWQQENRPADSTPADRRNGPPPIDTRVWTVEEGRAAARAIEAFRRHPGREPVPTEDQMAAVRWLKRHQRALKGRKS